MDIVLKPGNSCRHFLSFSRKLFLLVSLLFLTFAGCFIAYQYQREKEYKVEVLDVQLMNYNDRLHQELQYTPDSLRRSTLDAFIRQSMARNLRVTIIDLKGNVVYDNLQPSANRQLDNHLDRPEIQRAMKNGHGHDVRRTSETLGTPYFYSATHYSDCIIRSALPYDLNLAKHLAADQHYLWFTLVITFILIVIYYQFTSKLGTAINQLRQFAKRADKNEPIETELSAFPHNELGEISQHIIQIYSRLKETKEALYIEREKLITHLQTAREGLGVFTPDKKEILVNDLFIQYSNLISDSNLETTEAIFSVAEFSEISNFINNMLHNMPPANGEKRLSININKNGKAFIVECIIFQDLSFEISINDVTQEEEQVRLKRQLTQNIAHELKTPVSSIQGYLETIINNPDLPRDRLQAFLERCYAQSNRLTFLLRDISVLTRMDEASHMIDMEKVDITQLVQNMLNEVNLQLEERHITVINRLKPGIEVRGDHSLLYSIFRNLTDNAIAYAGTGVTIHINCFRQDERFYYFSFSDTGVGVAPEHLNRLFERFYRVDKGRSRKMGGTGLGLAIVKNAVILHGGTISAKNVPGGGLEFVFTLAKAQ